MPGGKVIQMDPIYIEGDPGGGTSGAGGDVYEPLTPATQYDYEPSKAPIIIAGVLGGGLLLWWFTRSKRGSAMAGYGRRRRHRRSRR